MVKETDIEREKYKLIEKVVALEEEISKRDTHYRRMKQRLEQCAEKFVKMDEKLLQYRNEVKQANKNVVYIIQNTLKVIHKISADSSDVFQSMSRILQSLSLGEDFDFESIKTVDWQTQSNTIFEHATSLDMRKINLDKVRISEEKKYSNKQPDTKKYLESLSYVYERLMNKLNRNEKLISRDDVSLLMDQFENQNELLRKNSSVLHDSSLCIGELNKTKDLYSSRLDESAFLESERGSINSSMYRGNNSYITPELFFEDNTKEYNLLADENEEFDFQIKNQERKAKKLEAEIERLIKSKSEKATKLKRLENRIHELERVFEEKLLELEGNLCLTLEAESDLAQSVNYCTLMQTGHKSVVDRCQEIKEFEWSDDSLIGLHKENNGY